MKVNGRTGGSNITDVTKLPDRGKQRSNCSRIVFFLQKSGISRILFLYSPCLLLHSPLDICNTKTRRLLQQGKTLNYFSSTNYFRTVSTIVLPDQKMNKKVNAQPSSEAIILKDDICTLSTSKDNTIHDGHTNKDRQGPGTGGDESLEGGDLEAAKRSLFSFETE